MRDQEICEFNEHSASTEGISTHDHRTSSLAGTHSGPKLDCIRSRPMPLGICFQPPQNLPFMLNQAMALEGYVEALKEVQRFSQLLSHLSGFDHDGDCFYPYSQLARTSLSHLPFFYASV